MRLRVKAIADRPCDLPFNYQYQLHSAIYHLIGLFSQEYFGFRHDEGLQSLSDRLKKYRLFTFSKLNVYPYCVDRSGFTLVKRVDFVFSTAIARSYEHLVQAIFVNKSLCLRFGSEELNFTISEVESVRQPRLGNIAHFVCLSPITISSKRDEADGRSESHFLDYQNPQERDGLIANLHLNLVRKYEAIQKFPFEGETAFEFEIDPAYLERRQGKIDKLIHFKNGMKIKAFEAPFRVKADPRLIRIGYECGFGEQNSAGFGCVEDAG